jgi:uncharacterized membrane protein
MSATQDQPKETAYNQIAGHSIERLAAISDGIFAVAMTLLVLDLRNPAHELIHSEQDFLHALLALFPQFDTYLMSFLTLTIFWNGQQAQLDLFARTNRHLTWIHMSFLFAVSIMPFSTRLLAEFINYEARFCAIGATFFRWVAFSIGAGNMLPGRIWLNKARRGLANPLFVESLKASAG